MSIWEQVQAGALGVLAIEAGVALLAWQADAATERQRANEREPRAPLVAVDMYCRANLTEFSCTFTNPNPFPVFGQCASGKLRPKASGAKGDVVVSQSLCSGVMAARETRAGSAALHGNATAACRDKDGALDFSTCELEIGNVP